jgi:hypothetical protein
MPHEVIIISTEDSTVVSCLKFQDRNPFYVPCAHLSVRFQMVTPGINGSWGSCALGLVGGCDESAGCGGSLVHSLTMLFGG